MKILSPGQIKELDAYTIEKDDIASHQLMERACKKFSSWFEKKFDKGHKIKIFCGMGDNGGDGLGITRLLKDNGYNTKAYIIGHSQVSSDDFKINLEKISAPKWIRNIGDMPRLHKEDIIIDAIFGSGLNKPISGLSAEAIDCINASGCVIVSVDIASGLPANTISENKFIIKPHFTFTFQLPKLAFLYPENENYVGEWVIGDIGLNNTFINEAPSLYFYSDEKYVKTLIRKRLKFSHKGTYGHALIMAGSIGKIGAALLASRACLRAGAGLLTIHSPSCGITILQTSIPEAMVLPDSSADYLSQLTDVQKFNAIGIGPGIGLHPMTCEILENLLKENISPLVIDADGLNILSQFKSLLSNLPPNTILTPHPKEFERITGLSFRNHEERLKALQDFCRKYKSIVVLKGHNTAIGLPDGEIYFNSTGNAGMATGGMGDVLTGVITSLLAQKYDAKDAAILGVYLHGKAGDMVAEKQGMAGMLASDLIETLPFALKSLETQAGIG